MNYQSGAVYSVAGDVYIKRAAFRHIMFRTMIIMIMAGLFLYPFIRYITAPPSTVSQREFIQIPLVNLPEGTSQLVSYHGQPVIIVNSHGNIKALSALSTYSNSLLKWDQEREEIVCPSDGSRFDLNGNVKSGLAPRPLDRIKVMVAEGIIIIGDL